MKLKDISADCVEVRSLIVKLASRCNLDCDYCYIYHAHDDTWKSMPFKMGAETVRNLINTIAFLYKEQQYKPLIAFHGGEPLLFGIKNFVELIQKILEAVPNARLTIQTNGTVYSRELELALIRFSKNLSFSLSIDGFEEENDRHRLDRRGRSRYTQITDTIKKAQRAQILDNILMVVDVENSAERTFSFMHWAKAKSFNLILRDGDHNNLPAGKSSFDSTEVGRWLLDFAKLYFASKPTFQVQFLDEILNAFIYKQKHIKRQRYNIQKVDLTVDTDGEIKLVDTLRVNAKGNDFASGHMVSPKGLETVLKSDEVSLYIQSEQNYHVECKNCQFLNLCGGGYLQHRWREGSYNNPSVYCSDYKFLFHKIEGALT